MKIRYLLLAGVAVMAMPLAGCNSQDAGNLAQDVGKIARDTTHAAGNAQLVARVNAALAQRKGVAMNGLHITAEKGVVTVGGHVRDAGEKHKVLETVNEIRGVDRIVDQLRIQPR